MFRKSGRLKSGLTDDVIKQLCPSCPQHGAAKMAMENPSVYKEKSI